MMDLSSLYQWEITLIMVSSTELSLLLLVHLDGINFNDSSLPLGTENEIWMSFDESGDCYAQGKQIELYTTCI